MNTKTMLSNIHSTVANDLKSHGFTKSGGVFTCSLKDADIRGWLGLNHATIKGKQVSINPVLGVHHVKVETLLSKLKSKKYKKNNPPTVTVPLGYISSQKQYKEWVFELSLFNQEIAHSMTHKIVQYGLPFFSSLDSLDAIKKLLSDPEGFSLPHQTMYRLPIVLFLMGKKDAAIELTNKQCEKINTRNDMAAKGYKKFHRALIQYINEN